MAARKPLRAVTPDEKAPSARRKRLTVSEAADAGTHRELLVSMRERVARTVDDPNCPARELAALTRRLQEIAREIEAIDTRALEEVRESGAAADEAWDAQAL